MSIFDRYTIATSDYFPEKECVQPVDEKGVYESPKWYECVIVSEKFPHDGFHVQLCRPYIWTDGKLTSYGWIHDKQTFYDNYQNPVRNNIDGYAVIAYRRIINEGAYNEELEFFAKEITKNQVWDE